MSELTHAERHQQDVAAKRADYIRGMVELADLLDANPDVPLPRDGRTDREGHGLHLANGDADRLIDLLGRPVHAEVRNTDRLWLTWHIAGLAVLCSAGKCEPEVTGVRVVGDREVPVIEYTIPERFQPVAAESAVSA